MLIQTLFLLLSSAPMESRVLLRQSSPAWVNLSLGQRLDATQG